LLAQLDRTDGAAQITALDELRQLADDEVAVAVPALAAELSPELEAILVGSLARGDDLAGALPGPAGEGGASAADDRGGPGEGERDDEGADDEGADDEGADDEGVDDEVTGNHGRVGPQAGLVVAATAPAVASVHAKTPPTTDGFDVSHQGAASFSEAHEDFERLAAVVFGDGDVESAERGLDSTNRTLEQLRARPFLPPLEGFCGTARELQGRPKHVAVSPAKAGTQ